MRLPRLAIFACLVLVANPLLALAPGTARADEPDTPQDTFVEPAGASNARLDVVLVRAGGELDAQVPAGLAAFRAYAYLGLWTDCDGDGHVGNRVTGLLNAPPEALVLEGRGRCSPSAPEFETFTRSDWGPYRRPLGGARVWSDFGWPGEPASPVVDVKVRAGYLALDAVEPGAPAPASTGLKTHADLTYRYWAGRDGGAGPMPDSPQFSACTPDACSGWWSDQLVLLPKDPAMYVGLRMVSYASGNFVSFNTPFVSTYGLGACGSFGRQAPPERGWSCNPDAWPDAPRAGDEVDLVDFDVVNRPISADVEPDRDHDGLGDEWEAPYREAAGALDALSDLDGDCLTNAGEFAWLTIPVGPLGDLFPNARDFDGDNLTDAEEVALWNHPANDAAPYFAQGGACPARANAGATLPPTGVASLDPDATVDTDGDGLANIHDPDSDADGLLDGDEVHGVPWFPERFTSDPALADTDGDGLPDAQESGPLGYRSDPRAADSDLDGLPDALEASAWIGLGHDPREDLDGDGLPALLDADSDGDGLTDGQESAHGANMSLVDSDGDGMGDGWEVAHGLAPADPADAAADPDGDGLANLAEYRANADPHDADADHDGVLDPDEVLLGLRADRWDTDGDGMPDGWELEHGLDPRDPTDAAQDPDADVGRTPAGATYVHTNVAEYRDGRPVAWNESIQGTWWNGTDPRVADTDHDGASDGQEFVDGTPASGPASVAVGDADGDGLTNQQEIDRGLDPNNADTDGDGLCDGGHGAACRGPDAPTRARGEALDYGSNPYAPNVDTDGDGLSDGVEAARPGAAADVDGDGLAGILDFDSDGDGLPDGLEVAQGSDPERNDTDSDGLDDAKERELATDPTKADTDGDGLDDGVETKLGTDPRRADSDGDGLNDSAELAAGSDPWSPDTDGDGMPDGWEVEFHLDPRSAADAALDPDGDRLANLGEFVHRAWPNASDTDHDLIPDGAEVALGLDPALNDLLVWSDPDGDNLSNAEEYALGTDPLARDTDGDGIDDGAEARESVPLPAGIPSWPAGVPRIARVDPESVSLLSDPTKADTDADGLDDRVERDLWSGLGPSAVRTDYRPEHGVARPGFVSNLREADADGDGLDDGQEFRVLGTDPRTNDTDGDTYTDFDEVKRGSDPRDPASTPGAGARLDPTSDRDGDGLKDWVEIQVTGTDPAAPDTDGDGLDDANEILAWTTRLNRRADATIYGYLRDADVDRDGLPDGEEFATGALPRHLLAPTDPFAADSDGDGLLDGQEQRNPFVAASLAALAQRASRDPFAGLPLAIPGAVPTSALPTGALVGAWRVVLVPQGAPHAAPASAPQAGGAPAAGCRAGATSAPDALDSDGDGIADGAEVGQGGLARGDPCSQDGDGDGIPDAVEERRVAQVDPDRDGRLPALDPDSDGDGLADGAEDANANGMRDPDETGALDQDTDDDGLTDQTESAPGSRTNALDADSDHDGLPDGLEMGLVAPQSSLPDAFGTDRSAERACAGIPVGASFLPTRGGTSGTQPDNRDSDADGVLDAFEDLNANGVYGLTAKEGGTPGEVLPSGWPELNPGVADSDGDGLTDGEELGLASNDWFCNQFLAMGGSWDAVAERVGYPDELPHVVNPHVPDTDGDGVVDAVDVDPRNVASVLTISMMYQQLEPADWLSENEESGGGDPWAPDLDIHVATTAAGSNIPLDLALGEDLHAKNPVNPLELLKDWKAPSKGDIVWNAGKDLIALTLPQPGGLYASASDPTHAIVTITARDRDVVAADEIALGTTSSNAAQFQVPLMKTSSIVMSSHGATGKGAFYSWTDPKDAAITLTVESAFDGFFLQRAVAKSKVMP